MATPQADRAHLREHVDEVETRSGRRLPARTPACSAASSASAPHAICPILTHRSELHYCILRIRKKSIACLDAADTVDLTQRELHGDGHDDRHRYVVEQRRRELPLPHGVERRLVEQRNRAEHPRVLHLAVRCRSSPR